MKKLELKGFRKGQSSEDLRKEQETRRQILTSLVPKMNSLPVRKSPTQVLAELRRQHRERL